MRHRLRMPPMVAVIAILCLCLLAYVGAYWSIGARGRFLEEIVITFPSPWLAQAFYPAMYLEEKLTDRVLRAGCEYPHGFVSWEIGPEELEFDGEDQNPLDDEAQ